MIPLTFLDALFIYFLFFHLGNKIFKILEIPTAEVRKKMPK
jgi:hypothetical protein